MFFLLLLGRHSLATDNFNTQMCWSAVIWKLNGTLWISLKSSLCIDGNSSHLGLPGHSVQSPYFKETGGLSLGFLLLPLKSGNSASIKLVKLICFPFSEITALSFLMYCLRNMYFIYFTQYCRCFRWEGKSSAYCSFLVRNVNPQYLLVASSRFWPWRSLICR